MVENAGQSGFECPIIIKHNTLCPQYIPIDDGDGHVVVKNGIVMISSDYTAPYDSIAHLLLVDPAMVAFVLNMDTGELRYYDGSQAGVPTVYIDPLWDAVGTVSHWEWNGDRPVKDTIEVANPGAADLRETVLKLGGSIDKMFSGRWRTAYAGNPEQPAAVTTTDRIRNPIGMTGIEAILDLFGPAPYHEGYARWFTIIFYARDNSDTVNGIRGNCTILTCCKFSNINGKVDGDSVLMENLKFSAMDMIHAPRDVYQTYTYSFTQQ